MKRILSLGLLVISLSLAAFAQGGASGSLGTLSATGAGPTLALKVVAHWHTVSVITTGSPTSCTIRLEGSLDGTNFFDLSGAQTCTSSVMFHVFDKAALQVRAYLITIGGGSTPAVAVTYLGVQ